MMSETPKSPFLETRADQLIYADSLSLGLWDQFPVSPGHALVVPRRVMPEWFDATREEQMALLGGIETVRDAILAKHKPDGFNIGINVGPAAGQTVRHLHVHVIPRYSGDVVDPTGGVRGVIPGKSNYTKPSVQVLSDLGPGGAKLITGGDECQLLPELRTQFERAVRVDMAVAFVFRSGVDLLFNLCRDLIDRRAASGEILVIRLITGDYLGATDPDALRHLCDLGDAIDIRVFETRDRSYHPKTYIFHHEGGGGVAFVGSSNLSRTALTAGTEWNYRVVASGEATGFSSITAAFEELHGAPQVRVVDPQWIEQYEDRRQALPPKKPEAELRPPDEPPPVVPEPHEIQENALAALQSTRDEGNRAGLVVLATGLGKTWLAAFDSNQEQFGRVLFVAHREEILKQALATFRRIRPHATLGMYTGTTKQEDADVLFASVQTLGRQRHLDRFDPSEFDYIVVDEFHHAHAKTYRKLIDHFVARFLLGLTATPERTDGGDILSLCEGNLVYRCDLMEGIRRGHLSAFRYYGVPDGIDYTNIPWRSGRFDPEAITAAYAVQARAANALEQLRKRGGSRTLCFCCSVKHANFMRDYLNENGVHAAAVHSEPSSDPRTSSLEQLEAGELDVVCAVDMFNEGVDLPRIDTVLMLRPTESAILWLQQLGRGLRRAEGKDHLRVIDYIGNHLAFLVKPMTLLDAANDGELRAALTMIDDGDLSLPPGCEVTYELEAMSILRQLLDQRMSRSDRARAWYDDFKDRMGERPRAVEALHKSISLTGIRSSFRSWLHFVEAQGDLSDDQASLLAGLPGEFLQELEVTRMTKSYKMVVLKGMLAHQFPGRIGNDELVAFFKRHADRSSILKAELGRAVDDEAQLRKHIEDNPIAAWIGREASTGQPFFEYANGEFASAFPVDEAKVVAYRELVEELVEFRLAEYWQRYREKQGVGDTYVLRVIRNATDKPILMLPDRDRHPAIPTGPAPVSVDGRECEATFAKIAVNVVRGTDGGENELPQILGGWFGDEVGARGHIHKVYLRRRDADWSLSPVENAREDGPQLYAKYLTNEIKGLFHTTRRTGNWMTGYVRLDNDSVLLVTLKKKNVEEHLNYEDRFLSDAEFEWESPARTKQADEAGQEIIHHIRDGRSMHLFVRPQKTQAGKTVPYTYCGTTELLEYEKEAPIRCRFRLAHSLPDELSQQFLLR